MIQKIKRMLSDHKAMNILRENHGDCELVAFVGVNPRMGWDCVLFQGPAQASCSDPSEAIIRAYRECRALGRSANS